MACLDPTCESPPAATSILIFQGTEHLCFSSKWFMQDIGHAGLNNLLAAYEDKGAKAVCTFGFSQGPGHEPILFQGVTDVSVFNLAEEETSSLSKFFSGLGCYR